MKVSALALAAASSTLVAAQSIPDISGLDLPPCAAPCLLNSLSAADCDFGDIACSCTSENQAKIKKASQSCLDEKCSKEDAAKAVTAGEALCKSTGGGSASGSESGSASAMPTGTGSAPGTMDSTTPMMTMSQTTASMGMSSALNTNSTGMIMPTTTPGGGSGGNGGSGGSGSQTSDGSGGSGGSNTESSTSPSSTDSAAGRTAIGAVAAIMAAVFAL